VIKAELLIYVQESIKLYCVIVWGKDKIKSSLAVKLHFFFPMSKMLLTTISFLSTPIFFKFHLVGITSIINIIVLLIFIIRLILKFYFTALSI
jgi:tryptophan-rich sensory protein